MDTLCLMRSHGMRRETPAGMLAEERLERIAQEARAKKFVSIQELSNRLSVTQRTLRRDLEELERRGIVRKTRGGAVWVGESEAVYSISPDLPPDEETVSCRVQKARIGAKAASLIKSGESIIIDAGTTTLELARNLHYISRLAVSTNDVNVALELSKAKGFTIVLTGGVLRESTLSLVGPQAEETLKNLSVDKAFLGTSGVTVEHGFANPSPIESGVKRAMIRAARQVFVLADHTKLGKTSFSTFARLNEVHALITDSGADPDDIQRLRDAGLSVIIA